MYYRISLGSDHAGVELKNLIKEYLNSNKVHKIELNDWGCYNEESVDYPDFAHKVASEVSSQKSDIGILVCGSGNGISMAANKWQEVRCALCWNPEIAMLAKLHNNANILSLPGRFIDLDTAIECVDAFLSTSFEGGRHEKRVKKIQKPYSI